MGGGGTLFEMLLYCSRHREKVKTESRAYIREFTTHRL